MPLEDHLLTESRNPRSEAIDTLSPAEIVRLMNSEDARVVEAVAAESEPMRGRSSGRRTGSVSGGRLVYVGAGPRAGWASSTPPSARRPSARPPRWWSG